MDGHFSFKSQQTGFFNFWIKISFVCVDVEELWFINSTETEGFKIDTMGTYHGLSLESVKVRCTSLNPGEAECGILDLLHLLKHEMIRSYLLWQRANARNDTFQTLYSG